MNRDPKGSRGPKPLAGLDCRAGDESCFFGPSADGFAGNHDAFSIRSG